ncbi:hypothetical protein HanRHA438_Chr15g0727111 [Helianthus annuus]|uniref:Uncharacterized protein n=1 Tax=Helianthus annuus TaxID=4232 RepID=A0A251SC24_HELAN|nr:hypothetical protein HanXRQr2_Chr15g0714881 [Helianthus annuus]KAJ0833067.1 hypothetical protein HanPSC8_Chr15g0686011 [Helianthus annuus]KAJ0846632.1 hypothetical protein HanRHA438_Chr15g0727111 [Helianthus annuus]
MGFSGMLHSWCSIGKGRVSVGTALSVSGTKNQKLEYDAAVTGLSFASESSMEPIELFVRIDIHRWLLIS